MITTIGSNSIRIDTDYDLKEQRFLVIFEELERTPHRACLWTLPKSDPEVAALMEGWEGWVHDLVKAIGSQIIHLACIRLTEAGGFEKFAQLRLPAEQIRDARELHLAQQGARQFRRRVYNLLKDKGERALAATVLDMEL